VDKGLLIVMHNSFFISLKHSRMKIVTHFSCLEEVQVERWISMGNGAEWS
jgi:hypothetical protein